MSKLQGRAILPADQLSSWSSRLKSGCGHDWQPYARYSASHVMLNFLVEVRRP
jgi:hypothetical protein